MPTRLENMLTALNSGYSSITNLIPNKYNFTDEFNASPYTSISDGGFDMYDVGNVINTNLTNAWNTVKTNGFSSRLATSIPYTHTKHSNTTFSFNGNGAVTAGTSRFGTGSQYVTNLYPGMFVLIATDAVITEFSITGNSGIDGGGLLATNDFTLTIGGNSYAVYRKTLYNTTDPGVNQIMIVPGTGSGITHSWDTSRQYDDNVIQGLSGTNDIYYLLIASRSSNTGRHLSQAEATTVITEFFTVLGLAVENQENQEITATSLDSLESVETPITAFLINLDSIDSAEAFGTFELIQNVEPDGFNDTEFGTLELIQNIEGPTSISSAESVNAHEAQNTIEATSIASIESVNGAEIEFVQNINPDGFNDTEFGTFELIQNIESPTSIGSAESVNNHETQNIIEATSIDSVEFVNGAEVEFISLIEPSGLSSDETFGGSKIYRARYVFGQMVCPNNKNLNCFKKTAALLPAVTVLRQKLYNLDPVFNREKQGFHVPIHEDTDIANTETPESA